MDDLTTQEKVILGLNAGIEVPDFDIDVEDPEAVQAAVGKIRKISRAIKTHGKKIKIDRYAIKAEMGASRQRLQVLDRIQMLPIDLQRQLIEGKAQISDKVLYSVQELASMKDGNLIQTDGGRDVGVRSFSNGKYGYFFLLQGIQLLYDQNSQNGLFEDDLPEEIRNGELTVKMDSKEIVSQLPVTVLASTNGYPLTEQYDFYKLKNPKWFQSNKDVQAKLALSADLNVGYVKILFYGQEIRPY